MKKTYYLRVAGNPFRKNDVIQTSSNSAKYKVLKVYKDNWLKAFLRNFGIYLKINQIKVKQYEQI